MMKNTNKPSHPHQKDALYEETHPEGPGAEEEPDASLEKWMSIVGSSTLFHVLILIFLGMLMISSRNDRKEQIEISPATRKETLDFEKEVPEINQQVDQNTTDDSPTVSDHPSKQPNDDARINSDHNAGESKNFISSADLNAESFENVVGIQGNPGGDFGTRGNGTRGTGTGDGPGGKDEWNAVIEALKWLARHQSPDGHWDLHEYTKQCGDTVCEKLVDSKHAEYNVGVTGLALLAFLGAGFTHQSPNKIKGFDFANVVKKGLFWLKEQQNDEGAFRSGGSKPMYNHSLATLAYAEAYGMTGAPMLREIAQRGIDYLQNAQNEAPSGTGYLGWRYEPNSGDNDTSVTGWASMALKSARIAGLETSGSSMLGALNWVKKVTNSKYGLTGYRSSEDAGRLVAVRGKNDHYKNHPSMTAIGMLIRMFVNKDPDSKSLKKGAKALMSDLPKWKDADPDTQNHPVDYYYWYYASLAMYMYAGPDSPNAKNGMWDTWNPAMKTAVLHSQETEQDGDEHGSWDPISRWSWEAGRVYATALNALTLEVYYRYDNAFMVNEN